MRIPLLLAAGLLGAACSGKADPPAPQEQSPTPAPAAAEAPAETAKAAPDAPPPLSEEDKRLIALDPNDLTPDERRKRAYALRRKVMQNPDSPTARTLKDLEEAYHRGAISKDGEGMPTFALPGTKPTHGAPPAGVDAPTPAPAGSQATP